MLWSHSFIFLLVLGYSVSSTLPSLPDSPLLGWVDWGSFTLGLYLLCWVFHFQHFSFSSQNFNILVEIFLLFLSTLFVLIPFLSVQFLFSHAADFPFLVLDGVNLLVCLLCWPQVTLWFVNRAGFLCPQESLAHISLGLVLLCLGCFLPVLGMWKQPQHWDLYRQKSCLHLFKTTCIGHP